MICRLCLMEIGDFVNIFNEDSHATNSDILELIQKCFKLEFQLSDPVSTKICQSCWKHLRDFNEFQLMINEKQQALELKTAIWPWPEIWHNTELIFDLPKASVENNIESALEKNENKIDAVILQSDAVNIVFDEHDNAEDEYTIGSQTFNDNGEDIKNMEFEQAVITLDLKMESLQENIALAKCQRKQPKNETELSLRPRRFSLRNKTTPSGIKFAQPSLPESTRRARRVGRPKLKPVKAQPSAETLAQVAGRKAVSRDLDEYIAANAAKLECYICAVPLQNFATVKRHFRAEHKCSGYVMCCNNRYRKRSLFVDHLRVHKDPTYFNCKICNKNFINRSCHSIHMLRSHCDGLSLEHKCSLCPRRFAKSYLLSQHMRTHDKSKLERTEKCERCEKAFRTAYELKAHATRMHFQAPIVCDICGATFRTKQNFGVHKRAVHHVGPQLPEAQCKVCERWLRDENSLRKHMYRHRDNETLGVHPCTQCNAVKSTAKKLSNHIRYHHSGTRYKCTICSKDFKQPILLDEHMATHTGIDLYTCPFCPRTFKSHANMHKHKKRMHPEQWVRKYTQPSRPLEQQVAINLEDALTAMSEESK